MAKDNKKLVQAITSQEENFAQWYTDICVKAELVEYSSVKGFIILRPYGQAIWDQHRHSHILMAGSLEPGIQVLLDQLPDGLTIGAQDDEALDTGVLHQLCLNADVGVPLCKVFFLAGDRLHKLLVVFCHFVISS